MANEIEFYDQFHGYTPAPAKIKYEMITRRNYIPYKPWAHPWIVTTSNLGTVDPTVVNSVTMTLDTSDPDPVLPTEALAFEDRIWALGTLTASDLLAIMPEEGRSSTIIDLVYGVNNTSGRELHLCLDLTLTHINRLASGVISSLSFSYISYVKYTEPNQNDVTYNITNGSKTVHVKPGSTWEDVMRFGILLTYPDDRLMRPEHAIMYFLLATCDDRSVAQDFYIPRTNLSQQVIAGTYSLINVYYNITSVPSYYVNLIGAIDMDNLALVDMVSADKIESPEAGDPSDEGGYGPSTEGGGGGMFDDSSDTIGVPNLPTLGASNLGFINVYEVTSGSLQTFANELFPPLVFSPPVPISATDVTDAVVAMANQFINVMTYIPDFFNQMNAEKYINYVLDCHIIPVDPGSGTPNTPIQVGNKTLLSVGEKLSSDYVEFDCGTLSLEEYYANFADFLTTFKLFLPFIGFVSAEPEWFYRESIQVIYHFNILDGSFVAYVLSTGAYVNNNNSGRTILGQYAGSCCVHIPITGQSYSSMVSTIVGSGISAIKGLTSAVAGTAGSLVTGNVMGAVGSAASGAGSLADSMLATAAAKPDVVSSNQYSASSAFLSCRRPFTMIERPVSSFPTTFAKENGVPSNVSKKLGNVTGFNIIGNLHLDGITATEAEKNEIESLLKSGVIL